ncbi:alpha/beta hydrolase [Arthrobacter sp. ES3-54]|jgi:pimeloyl-ACP methyl ester carboxylesterase|uniref:alpha/beta fold hydrolase n=1 Tax=Arthrobacter sp. ES3-54 TaxID=1502991 RepID=UPI002407362C|nr:alpha/beta hydrolase [Arthrobacter sp. ES3-54]MDF9750444.1 pimeloyl-ACP methyl ester carboxylesterase [Arthrobacter sp. ES3-54]
MVDPIVSDVHVGDLVGRLYASPRPPGVGRSGPALVLVHGIGVSHRYLHRLHGLLAESADTYSLDLPGFGGTPKPGRRLSVADYAGFILAVLDQAGVGPCILVGHSMGTQFAVEAATQQPGRFTQLVLMGPVVDEKRRSVARQALDLTLDCLFFETPAANVLVVTDYIRCGPRWYLAELPVMMSYRTEERIAEVNAPILILRGSRDPVASREWCRLLAQRAVAGEFREVPGCGHVVQHTGASRVAKAIRDFDRTPGRAREAPA